MNKTGAWLGWIGGLFAASVCAGEAPGHGSATPAAMFDKYWAAHYADVQAQMEALGPKAKDHSQLKALAAAKTDQVQALIWETDRHPTDVALRRTEALLRKIRAISGAPDLTASEKQLAGLREEAANRAQDDLALFKRVCALRRRIALANPLLDFDSLLFTGFHSNHAYEPRKGVKPGTKIKPGGNIIQGYNNVRMAVVEPKAGLYLVSGLKTDRPVVRDILAGPVLADGRYKGESLSNANPRWKGEALFHSFALSYDAKTLVFTWAQNRNSPLRLEEYSPAERAYVSLYQQASGKKISGLELKGFASGDQGGRNKSLASCHHLFRMNLDGTDLRQLTDSPIYSDYQPCWLPDGRIVFISDRLHQAERCGSIREGGNLFSMKADGSDLYPLSWHETTELSPCVAHDGRLVYTRWDYVDRDFGRVHNIWTCYPDGRDPRAPHANYEGRHPIAEVALRAIPGRPGLFSAIGSGHHSDPSGNIVLIDINCRDMAPGNWRMLWPGMEMIPDGWKLEDRTVRRRAFMEPEPLSEDFFVAAEWAKVLLVDAFGNEDLLFDAEETLGILPARHPTPVRARHVPPVIATATWQGERRKDAPKPTIAVMNVYDSDFEWPAGTKITALRIIQIFPKAWPWTWGIDAPPIAWSRGGQARMPLGTVPVEADGSAYFEAPIEREIYFQALNAEGLAVQSMRSGAYVHPGEQLSCTGCHEDKWKQRAPAGVPLAMRRAPSRIAPEVGGVEPVNYWRLAKPVLDAKCAACHQKEGKGISFEYWKKDATSYGFFGDVHNPGDLSRYIAWYNASWPGGTAHGLRTKAGAFGALGSKLLKHLGPEHHGVKLTAAEKRRITLWMDCNSVALGSFNADKELVKKQMAGELVWPDTSVDPANPQGLQRDEAPDSRWPPFALNETAPTASAGSSRDGGK